MEPSGEIKQLKRSLRERIGTLEEHAEKLKEGFTEMSRSVADLQILLWLRVATELLKPGATPTAEQDLKHVQERAKHHRKQLHQSKKPMDEAQAFADEVQALLDKRGMRGKGLIIKP
jgi:hypothetical protein